MAGKILITPNTGSVTAGSDPTIKYQGTGNSTDITQRVTSTGTLSFEGSTGQLFSIVDSMTGTIYSVNDVSGIPSIEVLDTGLVKLAQYSGNVLIGTGTDNGVNKLQVNGTVSSTGQTVTGAITATGNITAYFSDDRLKTRIGNIENALDKVATLDAFYYHANEVAQALGYTPTPEVGISAQQVQAIMPEVVAPAPIDNKYLTVRYERLVPLLVAAIKELQAEVEALKAGK